MRTFTMLNILTWLPALKCKIIYVSDISTQSRGSIGCVPPATIRLLLYTKIKHTHKDCTKSVSKRWMILDVYLVFQTHVNLFSNISSSKAGVDLCEMWAPVAPRTHDKRPNRTKFVWVMSWRILNYWTDFNDSKAICKPLDPRCGQMWSFSL